MTMPIETYGGGYFDFENPRATDIEIIDITRSLSNTCRFAGHIDGFYSVAEHALLVERLVREAGLPDDVCYAALHHDSHEAYLGDIVTPLKATLGVAWERLQWRTDLAICQRLGIDQGLLSHPAVKAADAQALLIEAARLKRSHGVGEHWGTKRAARVPSGAVRCFTPYQVEALFLRRHHELKGALAVAA